MSPPTGKRRGPPSRARYRTGDSRLDEFLAELIDAAAIDRDRDLVFEMLVSALRMGRESATRADLKLVNSALKELRYSFHVFEPYEDTPKVSIFGSARTQVDDEAYIAARDFGAAMAAEDWMVITGAGPGIMEAGVEGAGADRAFGVNILLPFESEANALLAGDPKLINFRYFFTRKVTFMKESAAFALLPGGFGTMDESFELLTLMQTGRSPLAPVVLLEPEGSTYWATWSSFVEVELVDRGLVSPDDQAFVEICTTTDEAVEEVLGFYDTFHSMRYVGRQLVIRCTREIDDDELGELNREFADIVVRGRIERSDASEAEVADDDVVDLPRLAFVFDRASFARLRRLVDRLNRRQRS